MSLYSYPPRHSNVNRVLPRARPPVDRCFGAGSSLCDEIQRGALKNISLSSESILTDICTNWIQLCQLQRIIAQAVDGCQNLLKTSLIDRGSKLWYQEEVTRRDKEACASHERQQTSEAHLVAMETLYKVPIATQRTRSERGIENKKKLR
ncbi:hypothetical protein M404DRAFT_372959 [Pisolithus tinctorius Marx 270]|uniref:Uncharacterized protein n=1 Tax=Pisolithus tinctorius Marx 270 TaxID=870435 RepID=A0A0C3NGS7_PISTI|nr:hypothetical protein M404DRAFT_372959 [Pisolithus tinctorius Marx 270]